MKYFIESQVGYCPLIWMFHGREENNKINPHIKMKLNLQKLLSLPIDRNLNFNYAKNLTKNSQSLRDYQIS